MRNHLITAITLAATAFGISVCSRGADADPIGHWSLDRPAARSAFNEASRTNPAVKQILSELVVEAGETPVDALVAAITVDYDLAANKTFSHSFKIVRDVPPHLKVTELQQSGTWERNGMALTLQPTNQNGIAVGMPPIQTTFTRESMAYNAFGVTIHLRRA